MKKAEIIKNGNVNISNEQGQKEPKIGHVDWDVLKEDYYEWIGFYVMAEEKLPTLKEVFEWFRNRLEK